MLILKAVGHCWRVACTGLSFAIFGVGGCSLAIVLWLTIYPTPLKHSVKQRCTRYSISWACWVYVRIMRCLGVLKFSFHNAQQLKRPAQLVVANHPSLLDAVFLLSLMPQANCIVKAALWHNPFTAGIVRLAGYINNNHGDLVASAAEKIQQGQALIIFPEGTRTRPSQPIYFKRGFANIAREAQCDITPVIINCTPPTLQKNQKWYHIPPQAPMFTFTVLTSTRFDDHVEANRPRSIQVRQLTRHLTQLIQQRPRH